MKAQLVFLLFILLSSVVAAGNFQWDQPPLEENAASSENMLFERGTALGVAAPRTFTAPSKSGFNFDSFAADDFWVPSYLRLSEIWIAIGVDQLDSYDIDSVFIGVYPDAGGVPNYDPYSPDQPAAVWSHTYDWVSNDPTAHFPAPWNSNPVRKGAINVTVDFALQPGLYWLTMHFEISSSDVSIPPATWLPGKTQGDSGSPARLYVPGNNPSAGTSNAFGWFWNTLRRSGLGDLSFKLDGETAGITLETNSIDNQYFYRCSGGLSYATVNVSLSYLNVFAYNESVTVSVILPEGSPVTVVWLGPTELNSVDSETSISLRSLSQGNDYPITLSFNDTNGDIVLQQDFIVRSVNNPLFDPEWIVRDEYGLIGGLFRWRNNSISEYFDFQIDEDDGDFSMPELSVTLPGYTNSYRPTLGDYEPTGNISMFGARAQAYYVARIRAVNPDCGQSSNWVTIRFQSDECELLSGSFPGGTYNFKKGKFSTSSFVLNEYGTITDLRVRVRGFHQRWSDVGLAIKTPVTYEGTTIDVPLFAEDCSISWDTHNPNKDIDYFEIYFVIGGNDDSLCPRPPLEGEPTNSTHVEPWGVNVFKQFVAGRDKRGTWALEWIDYGIGFPTNGKITDFDTLLCTIPVPPREHIIYKGESKVRRGTVALYGP